MYRPTDRHGCADSRSAAVHDGGMANPLDHELLDVGDGRRLDRFGSVVVDRPAPGATEPRRDPRAWRLATARFERAADATRRDEWRIEAPLPDPWLVHCGDVRLELRPATGGQVGCFPEQGPVWVWMARQLADRAMEPGHPATGPGTPPAILHLFAYTGAATIACASAGATVVHVDAARTAVGWARRNAARNGVGKRSVRWLVDDATAFAARERRRRHRYDGVVLDPPTYGHGEGGRTWRIERDLDPLLEDVAAILTERPAFVVLSAHTSGRSPTWLAERLAPLGPNVETGPLELVARSGAVLALGSFARWVPR